jgi:hypothetical protein
MSCSLFSAQLQQFAADTGYESEDDQVAETRMGIDGQMVAGQTPNIKVVNVHLEASSPSVVYLNLLKRAMEKNRTVYPVSMVISQPAIGRRTTYSNGVLQSAKDLADGKKILDPTTWTFHFQDKAVEQM